MQPHSAEPSGAMPALLAVPTDAAGARAPQLERLRVARERRLRNVQSGVTQYDLRARAQPSTAD